MYIYICIYMQGMSSTSGSQWHLDCTALCAAQRQVTRRAVEVDCPRSAPHVRPETAAVRYVLLPQLEISPTKNWAYS